MADRGRCINCGFLCQKNIATIHTSAFRELTPSARQSKAYVPEAETTWRPWCFRMAPLWQELALLVGTNPPSSASGVWPEDEFRQWNDAMNLVATRDRQCALWFPYQEGEGPDRHLQEYRMQDIISRREAFDRQLEKEREDASRRANEAQRRERRTERLIGLAALLFALGQIVAAALTAGPDSLLGRLLLPR